MCLPAIYNIYLSCIEKYLCEVVDAMDCTKAPDLYVDVAMKMKLNLLSTSVRSMALGVTTA